MDEDELQEATESMPNSPIYSGRQEPESHITGLPLREFLLLSREEVRENYLRSLRILLESDTRVGIATHDEVLVSGAQAILAELDVPPERYEFQMLLGVRGWLRDEILESGHPMRIYVPFGAAWYEYSVRRLRENPAIAGHVFKAMLGLR